MAVDYKKYYEHVLEWAELAFEEDYKESEGYYNLAWEMVIEEHKELKDGIIDTNTVQVRDALCDCFVTLVQLNNIIKGGLEDPIFNLTPINKYLAFSHPILTEKRDASVSFLLHKLLCCMRYYENTWPIEEDLQKVLASNDSKFPTLEVVKEMYGDNTEEAIKAACDWIESNSKYENITGQVKNGRVIFRCNGGEGKIVKPFSFKEPGLE